MKRLAVLACVAVVAVACGNESADAPADAVEPVAAETAAPVTNLAPDSASGVPTPLAAPSGLVSRTDVVITAPTVLWFWAPG